jgi:putative ABC transport system ATP-binding protein
MGKTIIDAHTISKVYNQDKIPVHALQDVHLHIEEGEFVAIVGPSGSGKSTLLNAIGGLDTPTTGQVILDGTDITTLSENELIDFRLNNIGFVFQAFNLVPVLTAKENVSFVMLLQKTTKEKRNKRAEELLIEVGLKDKMNSRPGEYWHRAQKLF